LPPQPPPLFPSCTQIHTHFYLRAHTHIHTLLPACTHTHFYLPVHTHPLSTITSACADTHSDITDHFSLTHTDTHTHTHTQRNSLANGDLAMSGRSVECCRDVRKSNGKDGAGYNNAQNTDSERCVRCVRC